MHFAEALPWVDRRPQAKPAIPSVSTSKTRQHIQPATLPVRSSLSTTPSPSHQIVRSLHRRKTTNEPTPSQQMEAKEREHSHSLNIPAHFHGLFTSAKLEMLNRCSFELKQIGPLRPSPLATKSLIVIWRGNLPTSVSLYKRS